MKNVFQKTRNSITLAPLDYNRLNNPDISNFKEQSANQFMSQKGVGSTYSLNRNNKKFILNTQQLAELRKPHSQTPPNQEFTFAPRPWKKDSWDPPSGQDEIKLSNDKELNEKIGQLNALLCRQRNKSHSMGDSKSSIKNKNPTAQLYLNLKKVSPTEKNIQLMRNLIRQ